MASMWWGNGWAMSLERAIAYESVLPQYPMVWCDLDLLKSA
jgi:hypothetical protein